MEIIDDPRTGGARTPAIWRIDPMQSAVLVTVASEIDLAAVPTFTRVLGAAAEYGLPVILNCTDLKYLDSTGMDVLLRYRTRVPRVALASPRDVIRKIFGVLSLDTVIPMYESVDGALAACTAPDASGGVRAPVTPLAEPQGPHPAAG